MYSGWKNEVFFIFRMKKEKKIIQIFLRGRKCVFLGEFKKIIIFQGKEVGIYLQFGFISSLDKKMEKKELYIVCRLERKIFCWKREKFICSLQEKGRNLSVLRVV